MRGLDFRALVGNGRFELGLLVVDQRLGAGDPLLGLLLDPLDRLVALRFVDAGG